MSTATTSQSAIGSCAAVKPPAGFISTLQMAAVAAVAARNGWTTCSTSPSAASTLLTSTSIRTFSRGSHCRTVTSCGTTQTSGSGSTPQNVPAWRWVRTLQLLPHQGRCGGTPAQVDCSSATTTGTRFSGCRQHLKQVVGQLGGGGGGTGRHNDLMMSTRQRQPTQFSFTTTSIAAGNQQQRLNQRHSLLTEVPSDGT